MPATPPGTGADLLANNLFASLVGLLNSQLPDINLFDATHDVPWDAASDVFKPVQKVDVTQVVADFNALMAAFKGPLAEEYEKGRITGAEYAKTYIALTQSGMQAAVQVALGKDLAFWQAAKTQAEAITAKNQNELMRHNIMLARAQYALTKLKLSSEDSAFGVSELNRTDVIPNQVQLTITQKMMVSEQANAASAQTRELRISDGQTVAGLMAKQKDLYAQQKQSYIDDTKIKAGKIFADLWITEKTITEPTTGPTNATSAEIDKVLESLQAIAGAIPVAP